jgi:hypothetical protein
MFLCDDCAKKFGVDSFELLFGSRSCGECESCRKVKSCVDTYWHNNQNESSDANIEIDQ